MTTELRPLPPAPPWPAPPARTGLATASLVLGILAVVWNVLLIPTVLSIVFGTISLAHGSAARTRAVVGIVLGGVGVLAFAVQIMIVVPLLIAAVGAHHVPYHLRMAASIEHALNEDGSWIVSDVRCPAAGEFAVGKRITCTAYRQGVGPIRIDVTFTSDTGAYTWVTESTQEG